MAYEKTYVPSDQRSTRPTTGVYATKQPYVRPKALKDRDNAAQDKFFMERMNMKITVTINTGMSLSGVLKKFDKYSIVIENPMDDGGTGVIHTLVFKSALACVETFRPVAV